MLAAHLFRGYMKFCLEYNVQSYTLHSESTKGGQVKGFTHPLRLKSHCKSIQSYSDYSDQRYPGMKLFYPYSAGLVQSSLNGLKEN